MGPASLLVTVAWSLWLPGMSPWLVLSMLVLNCDSLPLLGVFRFLLKNKNKAKTREMTKNKGHFCFLLLNAVDWSQSPK